MILHIAKHRGYGNKHEKRDLEAEERLRKKAQEEEQKILSEATQEKGSIATNQDSKKEKEQVLKALHRNEIVLKSYQSVGERLYKEFEKNGEKIRNTKNNYQHTMKQEWLEDELKFIFHKQRELGFSLSEKLYKVADENGKTKELDFESAIIEIAFFQRDLKSFEDKVGKCIFYNNEPRAPKDSWSAMEFVAFTYY